MPGSDWGTTETPQLELEQVLLGARVVQSPGLRRHCILTRWAAEGCKGQRGPWGTMVPQAHRPQQQSCSVRLRLLHGWVIFGAQTPPAGLLADTSDLHSRIGTAPATGV